MQIKVESNDGEISIDLGKYSFHSLRGDYRIEIRRRGESWVFISEGHKAVLALMHAIEWQCAEATKEKEKEKKCQN